MAEPLQLLPLPTALETFRFEAERERPRPGVTREVRELTLAEVNEQVSHIFTENSAVVPSPQVSTIVGVVENGEVVAFLTLQLCLHADPVWTKPGRSDLFQALVREAEQTVARKIGGAQVFLLAEEGSRVERLAQAFGFEPGLKAMSKYVAPAVVQTPPPLPEPAHDDPPEDPDDRPFDIRDFENIT